MVLDDDSRGIEWRCYRLQPHFKSEAARQRRKILEAMSERSSSVGVSELKEKKTFSQWQLHNSKMPIQGLLWGAGLRQSDLRFAVSK